MNNEQAKSYRSEQWYAIRERVIARDSFCCARCGKPSSEVELHVHHIHYIKGRKAWDYPEQELITLCKGCHAKEHGHIMPQLGWEYQGEEDLGDLCGTCDLCGSELRYAHSIFHENWGYMTVGALCADRLTGTSEASEYEEERKKTARRLRTYIDSPQWKHRKNGHFRDLDGFHIKIWEHNDYCNIQIGYDKYNEWGYKISKVLTSKVKYHSLEEAKAKAFEVITTGKLSTYILRQKRKHRGDYD